MQWLERPKGNIAALRRDGWSEFTGFLLALNPNQRKIIRIAEIMRRRRHALFGCHARNAYVANDPRATKDIDLLVPDAAAAKRAGKAILASIPGVRLRTTPFGMVQVVTRTGDIKIADLVPADEAITLAAIATAKRMPVPSLGSLRVPPPELIVAMKLDSASDPRRHDLRADLDKVDAQWVLRSRTIDERALQAALALVPARAAKLLAKLRRRKQR